jgi:hypothetical protein
VSLFQCCPTHEDQVSTPREGSRPSPGHLHRHRLVFRRIYFIVGSIPEWATVG